jgi:mono/diheme cytochrome c family protein
MIRRQGSWILLSCLATLALGCDKGDYFPPERAARAVLNGWDMWATAAVSPYKAPLLPTPTSAVPTNHDKDPFATARAKVDAMPIEGRRNAGTKTFTRYCSHCHGANGDGRSIVGESFTPRFPDLRSPASQARSDRELYDLLMHGSAQMVPLDDTVTPLEAVLGIDHVRSLAGAPTRPLFPPKSDQPLQ